MARHGWILGFVTGLCVALASPRLARADEPRCDAPRVLIVLDKSSSMLGPVPDGGTKWEAAQSAIQEMTAAFQDRIDFGLMIFPHPDECHPGSIVVDCAPDTSRAIVAALGDPPPSGGNWTPMAQSIEAAGASAAMHEAGRRSYLLLVTDGWQWCDPYDADTRFLPVDAVSELHDGPDALTTFVVGFGDGVDFLTLNRAAVAGGSPSPGCDPDADEIGENGCHYQADDLADLRAAFDSIARTVTEEICDGTDNDCNGQVDEGFDEDGDGVTTCGSGGGRVDCDDHLAAVFPGHEEVCDGLDNDCDGEIDTGCDCQPDETRACGICDTGVQTCNRGLWGSCEVGDQAPPEETCNGVDDDCDGQVDEAVRCPEEGFACLEGRCVDLTDPPADAAPATPATDVHVPGGCSCRAGAGRSETTGMIGAAGLVGACLLIARRNRRRRSRPGALS